MDEVHGQFAGVPDTVSRSREGRSAALRSVVRPAARPAVVVGAAVGVALLGMALAGRASDGVGLRPVADTLGVVATALFFGAGMLRYTRWSVTAEPYAAAATAGLLVFAVAGVPMTLATRTMVATSAVSVPASLTRLVAVLAVAVLLAPVLRAQRPVRAPHPVRLAAGGLVVVLSAFALLVLSARAAPGQLSSASTAVAVDAAAAMTWLVLAGFLVRSARRDGGAGPGWGVVVALLLGVAGVIRSAGGDAGRWPWLVGVGILTLAAGVVAVAAAAREAGDALTGQDRALDDAGRALAESESLLASAASDRADLVHDARSMIAALRTALVALDRDAGRLDPGASHDMRTAMDAELDRLGRLIEGARRVDAAGAPDPEWVEVAQVLDPLLATMRADGLVVDRLVAGLWVRVERDALARILGNLLVNARVHAPGARVVVRGEVAGHVIRLVIEDDGPGVPAPLRDAAFDRGVTDGRGDGLGLDVARRAARAQGGDLVLAERPGGGSRFVLTLRGATGRPSAPVGRHRLECVAPVRVGGIARAARVHPPLERPGGRP